MFNQIRWVYHEGGGADGSAADALDMEGQALMCTVGKLASTPIRCAIVPGSRGDVPSPWCQGTGGGGQLAGG